MFQLNKKIKNSLGRAGVLNTPHGAIQTPAFVAVGTKATVKSLTSEQVKAALSQVVLANTYHLFLEPGEKLVKEAGGLGKFMNWSGPTMTDSGGFQAFSLGVAYGQKISKFMAAQSPEAEEIAKAYDKNKPRVAKVTEDGVEFKSIIDGSSHFFSPEKSIQIQNDLGADIIFAFDECTSPHADKKYLEAAMNRTHRWAKRSLAAFKTSPLASRGPLLAQEGEGAKSGVFGFPSPEQGEGRVGLFGIVQGGRHEDLRKESAKVIGAMDFEGFGIGGSFVKEDMATAVKWVNEILPEEKAKHLLGVGEPIDLILGVENGCDTFDCVSPTRLGRNGTLFTHGGKIHIENTKYRNFLGPIEKNCQCYTCQNYTAAYLSHLFRGKEMLAGTLATTHNLYFLNNLMSQIRNSILDDTFFEFKQNFLRDYK